MKNIVYNTLKEVSIPKGAKIVSATQYFKYAKCPKSWKLRYIDKIKHDPPSIHGVFGDAIHFTLQEYLIKLFTVSVKEADSMDLKKNFLKYLKERYAEEKAKGEGDFIDVAVMQVMIQQGIDIIDKFKKNRNQYFNSQKHKLIGVEIPLKIAVLDETENVYLMGYLDVVIYDKSTRKYTIIDFKTSTKGWRDYDKKDVKINQLLIYKHYFAKQYDIAIEDVDIEYLIFRREVDETTEEAVDRLKNNTPKLPSALPYTISRIQSFVPTNGKVNMKKSITDFQNFCSYSFKNGDYNAEVEYYPIGGSGYKNCKFCEFKDSELCHPKDRITK